MSLTEALAPAPLHVVRHPGAVGGIPSSASSRVLGGLIQGWTSPLSDNGVVGSTLRVLHPATAPVDVWLAGAELRTGRTGRVHWRHDGQWLFGACDCDEVAATGDLSDLARSVYHDIFDALDQTGMPRLVRLWNYMSDINGQANGLERYRQFNAGRQQAFLDARRDAFAGSPAACALGSQGGPFSVRFLAGHAPVVPLENPRQVPAWRYPDDYGPRSPSFARAVLVPTARRQLALFISGTASIVGHVSLHPGDVVAQTQESLRNLRAVIDAARARCDADFRLDEMAFTVYLRDPDQLAQVQRVVASEAGPDSMTARQAVYVQGDVCRADLLVEIEAHAVVTGGLCE